MVKGELVTWAAAKIGNSTGALPYFAEKKEELNWRRMCVLNGFLRDSGVPDVLELVNTTCLVRGVRVVQ